MFEDTPGTSSSTANQQAPIEVDTEEEFHDTLNDPTFILKKDDDILLVQGYVDDIIFGATNKKLCKDFEEVMQKKFEMSAMGELAFFLGIQVDQKADGLYIYQTKYVHDILAKFKMQDCSTICTPLCTNHELGPDQDGIAVDQHLYRSMIGSLMYLTVTRPYIMFAVCLCSRFQSNPKESHIKAVKRILRYLKT